MPSESICAAVAAAAFLLAAGSSHAQNKCIDERGKVSYQSDPCPGASARIRTPAEIASPPPAAPGAAPARSAVTSGAAVPPAAKPSGPTSPQALRVELQELEQCASDWEMYSGVTPRDRKANDALTARFLPACGKYGFESVRDDAAMKRNGKAAQSLARKIAAKRAGMKSAADRELAARAAAGRAADSAPPAR
jgi:hypothetical protein